MVKKSVESSGRLRTLQMVVVIVFSLLLGRVFYLQILDSTYDELSARNVLRREVVYAPRGEVLDRNGEYLVQSRGCYDVMVTYRDLDRSGFDTMLVCDVLDITKERLVRALKSARMRPRVPYLVANFTSLPQKLLLDEKGIPGFHSVYRTVRQYPRKIGGNLLGNVGEISEAQLASRPEYAKGDYIGVGGIESAYEEELRGEKGNRIVEVNTYGEVQCSHADGHFDILPQQGKTLVSTIDAKLQLFGEELMRGKVGSAVAIEPSTGQILMMVSTPTFDPDELVGRERGNHYMDLLNNPRRPLFNRAVTSRYPPGSIFKLLQGLIGLQDGVLKPWQRYECHGGFRYGTKILKCHEHKASTDLEFAVATSCNTYFCNVFCNILNNRGDIRDAYTSWREDVLSFGFGRKLDSDFLSEGVGYVPEASFYERVYRGSWNPLTVISLSIGQGELGCTPLQMANFAAILANRGYYYIPHIIREVEGRDSLDRRFYERQYCNVDSVHFEPIIQGMWDCMNVQEGSSAYWARVKELDMCGKTGTAQNPHGADHSTFLSFAPRNNPKIAVSVYVENGGWGSTIGLPIASLVEEYYLTDTISRQWLVDYVKNKEIEYPVYDAK